ncbi:MAG: hypothetical protein WC829_09915 [Hyphomicrobium sp.]|jgi:hypothetical protein
MSNIKPAFLDKPSIAEYVSLSVQFPFWLGTTGKIEITAAIRKLGETK